MNDPVTTPPTWLRRVAGTAPEDIDLVRRSAHLPRGRESAVLMLFGATEAHEVPAAEPTRVAVDRSAAAQGGERDGASVDPSGGATVVLTERAHTLRKHPGQVSFPGGGIDDIDDGPVGAALREAQEEVGVDPAGVDVVGCLPQLPLSVTGFSVTPILGWWREPCPIGVVDPGEVERVITMPVDALLDPAHRFMAVHPARQFAAPAFEVGDVYVWGFTAIVLHEFFELAGLTRPWDTSDERRVPERFLRA